MKTDHSGNEPELSGARDGQILTLVDLVIELARALEWERDHSEPLEALPDLPFHRLRHEFHVRATTLETTAAPMEYDEWRRFCRNITATNLVTDYGRYRLSAYADKASFILGRFREYWIARQDRREGRES